MEIPNDEQIAAAIIASKRAGESDEDLDSRIDSMIRLEDSDLAGMGVALPDPEPQPQPIDFTPVPVRRRHDGWTVERQRQFIAALAVGGCVSEACAEVRVTARSAYKLREHPKGAAFRAAWDHALSLASVRLTALAWERAVHGSVERYYKNGELVGERRKPSDRLLMWLLRHHDPVGFGWLNRPPGKPVDDSFYPVQSARAALPGLVGDLQEVTRDECPAELLVSDDYDSIESEQAV